MPWQCRVIDPDAVPDKERLPGDMWFAPHLIEGEDADYYRQYFLSETYFQRWHSERPPIIVRLPNGQDFCADQRPASGGSGWDVTGEPPNITVSPSINDVGSYHGWLQNGVLSDDVDGRTFPN